KPMPCDSFDGGRRCLPNVGGSAVDPAIAIRYAWRLICAGRRRSASVSRSTCDLGAASAAEERRIRRRSLGKSPASAPLRASPVDPLSMKKGRASSCCVVHRPVRAVLVAVVGGERCSSLYRLL